MSKDTAEIRFADLPNTGAHRFSLSPEPAALAALADALGLLDLRKLRFAGQITPKGRGRDWTLTGTLGATVVQPCIASLEPVTTRIDTPVERLYVTDFPEPSEEEAEMPEDDRLEPLPALLDLNALMEEALSLALPLYPRAGGEDADPVALSVTEPGKTPMTDEAARPFAGLAALRAQLGDAGGEDSGGDEGQD